MEVERSTGSSEGATLRSPTSPNLPDLGHGSRFYPAFPDPHLDRLTGRAWVDATWAALEARAEFSMLPHPIEPARLAVLAPAPPPPAPLADGPRIVFFGMGSDFGLAHLLALLRAGLPVVAVITSTRQPRHRFEADVFSLVEARVGLPRHALRRINDPAAHELLRAYRPDLVVIASFDQILRREVLDIPRLGVVNSHPSPLPAYRGPEPLFWQIFNREPAAGVTVYQVTEGIDDGPILGQVRFPLAPDATAGSLARQAAFAGAPLLLQTIDRLVAGEPPLPSPFADGLTPAESYYPSVESRPVNWHEPAEEIARLVRAGGADLPPYGTCHGRRLYLGRVEVLPDQPGGAPGEIIARGSDYLDVVTGQGRLRVRQLLADLPDYPNEHPPLPLETAADCFELGD